MALCEQMGVTLYAPVSENDFSEAKRKQEKKHRFRRRNSHGYRRSRRIVVPKETYCSPSSTSSPGTIEWPDGASNNLSMSVRNIVSVALAERLARHRRRVAVASADWSTRTLWTHFVPVWRPSEAKELYKLRRQTIELCYADLKEHRQLRRFNHYGPRRARAQIGASVLAYNLLILQKNRKCVKFQSNPWKSPRKSRPERRTISNGRKSKQLGQNN